MADEIEQDPTLQRAVVRLRQDDISYKELVALVASRPTALPVPEQIPLPPAITAKQREALDRLPAVFGSVVPVERRDLLPTEVTDLLIERDTLATIETMAADRKAAIRTTVLNAHDIRVEEVIDAEGREEIERDKDGHYILKGDIRAVQGAGQKFAVEARSGTAAIDPKVIKQLADDPDQEWISHQDYLDATREERVFDEAKFMILLRKKPELIRALREATVAGRGSVAVQPRKA
jgi:hypothetical protein